MLTIKAVQSGEFDLVYKISNQVMENYERLTSFSRGRDFNEEVKEYMISFVAQFELFIDESNEKEFNDRLVKYNKLVVDLRSSILSSTTIPSILISGGGNYPVAKKQKELARTVSKEDELYSNNGKHYRFMINTSKMFDHSFKKKIEKTEDMRQKRIKENGWESFFEEVDHDEIEGIGFDIDDNRLYIQIFDRPSPELKEAFKACALRWSPKKVRWQRILTQNAINSIKHNLINEFELEVEKRVGLSFDFIQTVTMSKDKCNCQRCKSHQEDLKETEGDLVMDFIDTLFKVARVGGLHDRN